MMQSAAVISRDGQYRYLLTRTWNVKDNIRYVNFIGLNPSTADAKTDDATIRRMIGFARDWGYDGLSVTNLCAYRSRDPSVLKTNVSLMSSMKRDSGLNDEYLINQARGADLVIACWGVHGRIFNRGLVVRRMLKQAGVKVYCLGLTKDRFPKHPLRLLATTQPQPW